MDKNNYTIYPPGSSANFALTDGCREGNLFLVYSHASGPRQSHHPRSRSLPQREPGTRSLFLGTSTHASAPESEKYLQVPEDRLSKFHGTALGVRYCQRVLLTTDF